MTALLEVNGVYARRGAVEVLRNVSLEVSREVVAVVGLNGSGKSTLLRVISGLNRPYRGEVRFSGSWVHRWPAHRIARAGLGFVTQSNQLFPEMTVFENLRLGGYRLSRRQVHAGIDLALEMFPRLKERIGIRATFLSGGERQMLAIAKVLVQDPDLLLLDEPTAGLSPVSISVVYSALAQIRQRGLPILLVEQNVTKALEIADRVVVLYLGEVAATIPNVRAGVDHEALRRFMLGERMQASG